jgi:hypothetical protein
MAVEDRGRRMARLKPGRPLPRWLQAKLSRRRKAAVDGEGQGLPDDPPPHRPMDIAALLRIVRSVADAGFGSGPRSLEARLCDESQGADTIVAAATPARASGCRRQRGEA